MSFFFESHAALEPIIVGFEQEEFTTNEGTMLSLALETSGPGFGSTPRTGGFDPQRDLGLVLVDGPPVEPCESQTIQVLH